MKKLFQSIRKGDLDIVKQLLECKPELVFCTAKQPPKKDDGQSPLQVAIKTGNFDIADYLLSSGSDINFMESDTCCNQWRTPVIHDAITAAVMCSRWNVNSELYGGIKEFSTKEQADGAFRILKRMIELGADLNSVDSFGNSCVWRLCLQTRQILPSYNHVEHKVGTDRVITPELTFDITRIFTLLSEHGADKNYVSPNCQRTVHEQFKYEPLEQFINLMM